MLSKRKFWNWTLLWHWARIIHGFLSLVQYGNQVCSGGTRNLLGAMSSAIRLWKFWSHTFLLYCTYMYLKKKTTITQCYGTRFAFECILLQIFIQYYKQWESSCMVFQTHLHKIIRSFTVLLSLVPNAKAIWPRVNGTKITSQVLD